MDASDAGKRAKRTPAADPPEPTSGKTALPSVAPVTQVSAPERAPTASPLPTFESALSVLPTFAPVVPPLSGPIAGPTVPEDDAAILPAQLVLDADSEPRFPRSTAGAHSNTRGRDFHTAAPVGRGRSVAEPVSPAIPAAPTAYERLGRAFDALKRKDFATAESELQWAIALEPNHPRLRIELGLVYSEWSLRGQDHDGAAEAAFARAAELDPSSDAALVHLAEVQLRRGLLSQARQSYDRAQKANPHSRAAEGGLAAISAIGFRRKLLASLPVAASLFVVASAGWFIHPRRPAEPGPQIAQAAPPSKEQMVTLPASSLEALTRALAQANSRPVMASPVAPPRPAAPSPPPETSEPKLANAEPAPSHHSESRHHARSSSRGGSHGGELASLVKQGDSALRSGRVDDALSSYNKALKMDPKFAPAHRGLGSVYVMQGRDADAKAAYKEYLALAPKANDAPKIQALLSDM